MTVTAGLERDLALRLRIEALAADYAHCIDDDRLEEWPDFFVEGCLYRIITRENYDMGLPVGLIYCDGKGMLRDRISALRLANVYEPHTYRHMISAVHVQDSQGGEHHVWSNVTVTRTMSTGDMTLFTCGKYIDIIVEEAGALKYKERTIVLDSRRIDTLLVIPI